MPDFGELPARKYVLGQAVSWIDRRRSGGREISRLLHGTVVRTGRSRLLVRARFPWESEEREVWIKARYVQPREGVAAPTGVESLSGQEGPATSPDEKHS